MKTLISFFFIMCCFCCYAQNNKVETIELKSSTKYENQLKLSDIAERVTYIPLETTDDCLIGNRHTVFLAKDYIFVESGGIVMQFTLEGKFIRRINRSGNGPGEGLARWCAIDEANRLIYIYKNATWGVMSFNMDNGKFVKSIRNPFLEENVEEENYDMIAHIISFINGNLVFEIARGILGQNPYKYAVVDNDGRIIHKETNYSEYILKEKTSGLISMTSVFASSFFNNRSMTFLKHDYNDTIFRINQDYSCLPEYILNLPNHLTVEESVKLDAHIIPRSTLEGKNQIYSVRESDIYLDIYHGSRVLDREKK